VFGLIAVAEFHKHVHCTIVYPHCRCGAVIDNTDLVAVDARVLKRCQGSIDGLSLFESNHLNHRLISWCLDYAPDWFAGSSAFYPILCTVAKFTRPWKVHSDPG